MSGLLSSASGSASGNETNGFDSQTKLLINLRQYNGNNNCADCKATEPTWVSVKLGIYICEKCAAIHRELYTINSVRSLKSGDWDDSELRLLQNQGNQSSNLFHEYQVPLCFRRPDKNSIPLLRTAWIRTKYERLEFISDSRPWFVQDICDGVLMKKGRDDARFLPRRFLLSCLDYTLKYFNKEDSDVPKAVIRVADLNAVLSPDKMRQPYGMQLLFEQNHATRSIYVYAESAVDIVNWYTAIRSVKLTYRKIAFPLMPATELSRELTRDFVKEGWLRKTGPRSGDAFRRRWISLDARTLLYYEEPLDAVPKGEVYIGAREAGYDVEKGAGSLAARGADFAFSLITPDRRYLFSADTESERDEWVLALQAVLQMPVPLRSARAGRQK